MNATSYTIISYALGIGLLWGYALVLWLSHRAERRRAQAIENRCIGTSQSEGQRAKGFSGGRE